MNSWVINLELAGFQDSHIIYADNVYIFAAYLLAISTYFVYLLAYKRVVIVSVVSFCVFFVSAGTD